jgi:hypothetical protein
MKDLFWDTFKHGVERARLTPWLLKEHKQTVKARLAALRASEQEVLADEIEAAYKEMERRNTQANAEFQVKKESPKVTETATVDVEVKEEVEEEVEVKPKKRGRKPSSPKSL